MEEQFRNYYGSGEPKTENDYIIHKNMVRISVLTPYLVRIENQISNVFCDSITQGVVCRNFCKPEYEIIETKDNYTVKTEKVTFIYSLRKNRITEIILENGKKITDFYSENLKGTCRTLDGTSGKTGLYDGLISKNGVAVYDDSKSLIIDEDGLIKQRIAKATDIYYFAYGHNYRDAIKDYFNLTGFPALIPRFALGNWWSRYKAYTQQEYSDLIKRFEEEKIPLTVATIDMDWHWVNVVEKFGADSRDNARSKSIFELFYKLTNPGWTGYSWNTDLFPDPDGFLKYLKEKQLKITMNLHPASGCKYYEDEYKNFAEFMGIDPSGKEQIAFDITDPQFIEGYFKFLHHPHEEKGTDFWWIDWQQGTKTAVPGLDPLWALNHYHFLDSGRNGKRPLILSRYSGAGAHRYPLGFSGDTAQTWKTLDFQPYFTATASNAGYTWWSHDIGGHHFGIRDDELYLRWVQFGIFSPVMRLHSTSNEFMGKEPWKYRYSVYKGAVSAMRFRKRLIPYIYSINRLTAFEGRALTEPMYYSEPEDERAYSVPNEYYFGTELIVCPITEPADKKTGLAGTDVFLPKGRFTDIFTDRIYNGNCLAKLYRDEGSIPVLAREGAIIPLDNDEVSNGCVLPNSFEILIFRGTSEFIMYEDDGETLDYQQGHYTETVLKVEEKEEDLSFSYSVKGDISILPVSREFIFTFRDIIDADKITVFINGCLYENYTVVKNKYLKLSMSIKTDDSLTLILNGIKIRHSQAVREYKTELISKLQGGNNNKNRYNPLIDPASDSHIPKELKGAFKEADLFF